MPPGLIHENHSEASKSVTLAETGVSEPWQGAGGPHVDDPGGPEENQGDATQNTAPSVHRAGQREGARWV